MPVVGCFEERRASMSVSAVDIGLCVRRRQERLGHQHVATRSGLNQLASRVVVVLLSSISTSTIRTGHTYWNGRLVLEKMQISLARRTKTHTIIKPHGDGSEDTLQHTYVLVVSFQKERTRWRIKATGINATRVGRMLDLRDQEKIQMHKQR
jgi:hypothetical protein